MGARPACGCAAGPVAVERGSMRGGGRTSDGRGPDAGGGQASAATAPGRADGRPLVLHLGYEDPRRPGAGGGSVRTHEINRRLADAFAITVVCARFAGCRARTEDGVRYVHAGLAAGHLGSLAAYFAALPAALARHPSDLVVEDFGAPVSSVAVPRLTTRPTVGVVQWLYAREKSAQYHLPFWRVERAGVRAHRRLVAVSPAVADALHDVNPAAEVTVVPNGLDADARRPRPARPRRHVAYLGRLESAQKGLDLLLPAYAAVAERTDHDLLLGGDGPDAADLRRQAARLGVASRVRFVGRVPADRRFEWLASAAVVAMPSRYESFGMVAAEALAVGTPVVAFDIPCLRDLVDDHTGLVVPPYDVDAYGAALLRLLGDADARARRGSAGPARVADLDWDVLALQQAAVYRRALTGAPVRPGVWPGSADAGMGDQAAFVTPPRW